MIKAPEIETIQSGSQSKPYKTRLYRGVTKNGIPSEFDEVLVLAPGWLGSGTLHFAATHLAQRGHDVAVVNHDSTSFWHPNKDRSQHVHLTAKAASESTGKTGVIMIGHSLGNRDVHSASAVAIERQNENPDDDSLYRITAIGAIAGVGLSGKILHGENLHHELVFASKELIDHPIEELDIVGRSLLNFIRNPLTRAIEGLSAAVCDVRGDAGDFIVNMVPRAYVEGYTDHDGVIPLPQGRLDYDLYSGTHITPIVDGDILDSVAHKLYEPNNPTSLELARFAHAA